MKMNSRRRPRSTFQSPSDANLANRRSLRRRSTRITNNQQTITPPNTEGSNTVNAVSATPSIRNNARLVTVATGRQHNNSYRLTYRRNRDNPSPPTNQGALQNEFHSAHVINNEGTHRICICDNESILKSCSGCNQSANRRCNFHTLLYCSLCNTSFHRGCIASLSHVSQEDLHTDEFLCLQCASGTHVYEPTWDNLNRNNSKQKCARFGLAYPSTRSEQIITNRSMKKIKEKLEECQVEKLPLILDNAPLPYPSAIKMSEEAKERHVLNGRRFELSMLMYEVKMCTCCGRVQPGHVDPDFPKQGVPFEKKHLVNSSHQAWHCNCNAFCQGSQFYGVKKRSEIQYYKQKHDGQPPWIVLGLDQQSPNAVLCNSCYKEITSEKIDGEYNICHFQFEYSIQQFINPSQ